jgi:hypothetical protein
MKFEYDKRCAYQTISIDEYIHYPRGSARWEDEYNRLVRDYNKYFKAKICSRYSDMNGMIIEGTYDELQHWCSVVALERDHSVRFKIIEVAVGFFNSIWENK